ncbi:MAG TPA: hypothetical protein DEB40_02435 [Elusimicrobia bacterium]|nr:hypothetical protein [Elusimicrobiota bacterium]HBT60588.1 hypothetical protein [Elusimicrobiota bacterium]
MKEAPAWLSRSFFLGLFLLVLYHFLRLLAPFSSGLLAATVLAILVEPAHRRLARALARAPGPVAPALRANLCACLSTLGVALLIIGPFVLMLWMVLGEAEELLPRIGKLAENLSPMPGGGQWPRLRSLADAFLSLPFVPALGEVDLHEWAARAGSAVFTAITKSGRAVVKNAALFLANTGVTVFALFFIFRDGPAWLERVRRAIPMPEDDKERILSRVGGTVTGIVRAALLTWVYQTVCAVIGFLIIGSPAALTLGLLTGLAAFVPVAGAALVWLPAALFYAFEVALWKGVFLGIWSLVTISLLDNMVRTLLLGAQTRLPIVLLFFGVIGGLLVYGPRGLLLGPIIVAILPVLADIFESEFLGRQKPASPPSEKPRDFI